MSNEQELNLMRAEHATRLQQLPDFLQEMIAKLHRGAAFRLVQLLEDLGNDAQALAQSDEEDELQTEQLHVLRGRIYGHIDAALMRREINADERGDLEVYTDSVCRSRGVI